MWFASAGLAKVGFSFGKVRGQKGSERLCTFSYFPSESITVKSLPLRVSGVAG